jgi:hypothetical protein
MITGNESAQPQIYCTSMRTDVPTYESTEGLTIRQEFAARFMAALLVDQNNLEDSTLNRLAQHSVRATDALINQLNKTST